MLDRWLPDLPSRQMKRLLRNSKLTVICLILTIIVIRGNSRCKFGTSKSDLDNIRDTFSYIRKRSEPRRILEQVQPLMSTNTMDKNNDESTLSNSYAEFDITKILADDVDDGVEFKRDVNEVYSLGPKILDRLAQASGQEKSRFEFYRAVKPVVLLVTGSPLNLMRTPPRSLFVEVDKNKIDYCSLRIASGRFGQKLLSSHPRKRSSQVLTDKDATLTDMALKAAVSRYKDSNFVMHGWNEMVYDQKN
ncbi:hypothetical protein Leryth_017359 [Lithospermum erythrorhizon]|nr:hypothetical protein Leryth_017359 [Lithospermum erythrorhizon]